MDKVYDLFIVGMNVETFPKKVYKGFGGDFDEIHETGYKYHLYFKTFYEQYYCIAMYTVQEIDSSRWVPITRGRIEVRQMKELPLMQYVIEQPTNEYVNLCDYQITKTITNSYLDFSKYGNDRNSPTGYAIINYNKFKNATDDENAVKATESKLSDIIASFYGNSQVQEQLVQDDLEQSVNDILNNIFEDSSTIDWQHQCMVRKQGLYGSNTSDEQISK